MSAINCSGRKKTLNLTMKSQIASMIKNVIDDEPTQEDNIEESIFDQSEDDEEDNDAETQTNTTMTTINNLDFLRFPMEKSQTTKLEGAYRFTRNSAKDVLLDSREVPSRKAKKFQTINVNYLDANMLIMNQFNHFTFNQQQQQQQQQLPLFSPNYSMMPVNCYQSSFPKKKTQLNEEPLISELESKLSISNGFTQDIYMTVKGHFVQLSKNQQASRLCQFYIDQTPKEIIHLIFEELKDQIGQLLLDPYSNYFCLKIFYFLNQEDRIAFLQNTIELFDILSVNKIATYPIQCIIEHLSSPFEKRLIANIATQHLMKLSLDTYGTHVLEKIMTCFDYDLVYSISSFIIDNFLFLANNANGLCIVKKVILIEYKQRNFERLQAELVKNALMFVQNPYGNYALQTAIDNWDLCYTEEIMMQFLGKCARLSIQKFSSNVIERCFERSERFLTAFIGEIYINPCTMIEMMRNNYGNYVIQKALKTAQFNNKMILINVIQNCFDKLNDKKLVCKWRSLIACSFQDCPNSN